MKRLLFIALLAVSLTACGTAAAQTEPTFDNVQYLDGIRLEATRTADINTRTEALLAANEAMWPTVQAYYSGVNEFQYATARMESIIATFAPAPQPTPVPPTPVVIVQPVPADLNSLSEAEMRQVACQLLTIEYVDAFPGFGPATAQDIRTNLGC